MVARLCARASARRQSHLQFRLQADTKTPAAIPTAMGNAACRGFACSRFSCQMLTNAKRTVLARANTEPRDNVSFAGVFCCSRSLVALRRCKTDSGHRGYDVQAHQLRHTNSQALWIEEHANVLHPRANENQDPSFSILCSSSLAWLCKIQISQVQTTLLTRTCSVAADAY